MFRAQIEKVLGEFLKNKDPQVVVIKGPWGSGKTYFWEDFLKNNKNNLRDSLKSYSYCSVFGLKTVQDIRQAIIFGTQKIDDSGTKKTWHKLIPIIQKSMNYLSNRIGGALGAGDGFNVGDVIFNSASILGLLDQTGSLICIDDFERLSDSLDPREFLGVISELKDKRGCKVVLIFNDSKLEERASSAYSEFKEKIIDIELSFNPTSEEVAKIVFSNEDSKNELFRSNCVKLNMTNIRVLRQIERICELVFPFLNEYNPGITQQAIASIFLLPSSITKCNFNFG